MLTLAYAVALDQFHSLFFAGNSFFFFFAAVSLPWRAVYRHFPSLLLFVHVSGSDWCVHCAVNYATPHEAGPSVPVVVHLILWEPRFFFFNVFCNSQLEKKMQLCLPAMRRSTHAVKWVVVYWVNKKYKSTNFAWKKFTQHTGCILYIGLYNDLPLIADILPRKLIWRSPSAAPMEIIGTALRILSTNEPRRQVVDF